MHRRLVLAYLLVLASGGALAGGAAWLAFRPGTAAASGCGAVASSSPDAARAVTASFVRNVLVRARPSCSAELATTHLRSRLGGVPLFRTRYPLVAYRNARPDSRRTQAVYVLGGASDGGITIQANAPVALVLVGLAAPDAGEAGYQVRLRLEQGRWRVDAVRRVAV